VQLVGENWNYNDDQAADLTDVINVIQRLSDLSNIAVY
jgi:hypothetical protein